jgi:hypothetical protein
VNATVCPATPAFATVEVSVAVKVGPCPRIAPMIEIGSAEIVVGAPSVPATNVVKT